MNILTIFSDIVEVAGEVEADDAALLAGQTVPIDAKLTVGSVNGKPVYMLASLSTTPPA
jgi:hypothetical protein